MAENTEIQWATHTFNPWWGCEKVSEACRSCYAESFAKRVGENVWGGTDTPRRFFGDKHWAEPLKWNRAAVKAGERHRVFCASMADVFEDRRDLDASRARLWELIEATPALDWLLLSKRWGTVDIEGMVPKAWRTGWPANAWPGATVESQKRAEERLPALLRARASVLWLSMEPLLGEVDLHAAGAFTVRNADGFCSRCGCPWTSRDIRAHSGHVIDGHACPPGFGGSVRWGIFGGESGGKPRALHLEWVRSLVRQCRKAKAAPFVKQFGALSVWTAADMEEMRPKARRLTVAGSEVSLNDSHGGEMEEWPSDLRVREFPTTAPESSS